MERQQEAMHGLITTEAFKKLTAQMLCHIAEVNECCLELMIAAARSDHVADNLGLAAELLPLLRNVRPVVRRRAAQQPVPLVEMKFANTEWWHAVRSDPDRSWTDRTPDSNVPKRVAVRLVRTTLVVSRQCLMADLDLTRTLFGMSPSVAEVISTLRLIEIERIAECQFAQIRPRWSDHPSLWLRALKAAHANDTHALRELNLHALQLLAGESLPTSQKV